MRAPTAGGRGNAKGRNGRTGRVLNRPPALEA
jgi:hypothetical protein